MRISDWSSDVCSSDLLKAAGIGNLPCMIPLKNRDGSTRADPARPTLADGAVRHVGDPVAFVVAETQVQARDAAELIEVDYDALRSEERRVGTACVSTCRARWWQDQ